MRNASLGEHPPAFTEEGLIERGNGGYRIVLPKGGGAQDSLPDDAGRDNQRSLEEVNL